MINPQVIDDAYAAVVISRQDLFDASDAYEQARLVFGKKNATAIFEGSIEGKNKEQRDAAAAVLFETEVEAVTIAESNLRQTKLEHDLNMFELSRVKSQIRLLEAEAALSQVA